jgi:WXG100 family type VII secretion target
MVAFTPSQLAIDFARMRALSDQLAAATVAIAADLEQLDATATALRGEWSGEAEQAYAQAHEAWSSALADVAQILGQAHRATGAITDRHRTAERSVLALWGKS